MGFISGRAQDYKQRNGFSLDAQDGCRKGQRRALHNRVKGFARPHQRGCVAHHAAATAMSAASGSADAADKAGAAAKAAADKAADAAKNAAKDATKAAESAVKKP